MRIGDAYCSHARDFSAGAARRKKRNVNLCSMHDARASGDFEFEEQKLSMTHRTCRSVVLHPTVLEVFPCVLLSQRSTTPEEGRTVEVNHIDRYISRSRRPRSRNVTETWIVWMTMAADSMRELKVRSQRDQCMYFHSQGLWPGMTVRCAPVWGHSVPAVTALPARTELVCWHESAEF